jgi:hypothetical protein
MRKSADFVIFPLVNPSFDREEVAISEIRSLSARGLDDCPDDDRTYAWLAMLAVYPKIPGAWASTYNSIKSNYFLFVKDNGMSEWHTRNILHQIPHEQFGLKNNSVMGIVHGDIVRTGRTMFFLPSRPIPSTDPEITEEPMFQWGEHARRLERVLYTFASLNPGLGYMQGFNELTVPFYYVLLKTLDTVFRGDLDLV